MIAHRVGPRHLPSEVGASRRGGYARLVRYLVDPQNKHERVGAVTITNCHSLDPRLASLEVLAVQAQNKRVAEKEKTYHLVIGFPPGEVPAPEVLAAIEATMVERLGFAAHQRISVVHHDKDHLHVHVAINKIHPVRLTVHTPKGDFRTLARACEELELKYELQRVNHVPRRERSQGAEEMEKHSGLESLASWAREQCLPGLKAASTWQELHRAAEQHGLKVQLRGAGCVLVHGDVAVRASSVARELALSKLVERLGPYEPALGASVVASEALRAEERAREANRDTRERAGRRRGQSDGVLDQDGETMEPPIDSARVIHEALDEGTYRRRPAERPFDTRELFTRYELERERAGVERGQGLSALRSGLGAEIAAAKRKAKMRRLAIKLFGGRDRVVKRLLYAFAQRALRRELAAIHERHRKDRGELSARTRRTGWTIWLQEQACEGNAEALRVLRTRAGARPLRGDTVSGSPGRPVGVPAGAQTTKAGVLVYLIGQVVVREDAAAIRVGRGASALELREVLARAVERHGAVLHVEGEAEFRRSVAHAAALSGLGVRFDDAALEAQRQAYRSEYERRKSSHPTRASEPNADRVAGARAARQNRVRELPPRGVARERRGRESVLQGLLHGRVVAERASRDHTLRRSLSRLDAPPPALRARSHARAAAAARAAADKSAVAKARAAVGRTVPPAARTRVQSAAPTPPVARERPARQTHASRSVARGVGAPPPSFRQAHGRASSSPARPLEARGQDVPARLQPARPVGPVGKRPPPWCRHRLVPVSALESRGGRPVPPQRPDPVALYVAERESKRLRGLDVPKHRAWAGRAGRYVFAGRREVAGTALVLLRDGEGIVVMPVRDSQQASWWARQRIGSSVAVDGRGFARGRGR